jgi:hypothetical protein
MQDIKTVRDGLSYLVYGLFLSLGCLTFLLFSHDLFEAIATLFEAIATTSGGSWALKIISGGPWVLKIIISLFFVGIFFLLHALLNMFAACATSRGES